MRAFLLWRVSGAGFRDGRFFFFGIRTSFPQDQPDYECLYKFKPAHDRSSRNWDQNRGRVIRW